MELLLYLAPWRGDDDRGPDTTGSPGLGRRYAESVGKISRTSRKYRMTLFIHLCAQGQLQLCHRSWLLPWTPVGFACRCLQGAAPRPMPKMTAKRRPSFQATGTTYLSTKSPTPALSMPMSEYQGIGTNRVGSSSQPSIWRGVLDAALLTAPPKHRVSQQRNDRRLFLLLEWFRQTSRVDVKRKRRLPVAGHHLGGG